MNKNNINLTQEEIKAYRKVIMVNRKLKQLKNINGWSWYSK